MDGQPSLCDGATTTRIASTPCDIAQGVHKGLPVQKQISRISRLFEKQSMLGGVNPV
jgi:hypothetical protein